MYIPSLYQLIKKESEKKGRKLKIVCDWDECLQPLKAAAIFKFYRGKLSLSDFFDLFWENATIEGSFSSGGSISISLEGKEEIEAIEKYMKMREVMRNSPENYAQSFYGSPERWKTPLTSIAENLLMALKKDLISELIIISSYRKGKPNAIEQKKAKMRNTFGHFPQCELELTEVGKDEKGKYVPYRWQRMNELMPDWDIFVDDNPNIVKETIKNVPDKNKIYVLPGYKTNLSVQGSNIYHVKTTVSDLKDEDFKKAAEEYKAKKAQELTTRQANPNQAERERERESNIWKQPALYWVLAGITWITFLLIAFRRKKIFNKK